MSSWGKSVSASFRRSSHLNGVSLRGAVVEIEAVDVEVGDQSLLPQKTETAPKDGLDPTAEEIGVV